MGSHKSARRFRDFVIYIGIGVALVAVVMAFASYEARSGRATTPFELNGIGLAGTTAVVFGEIIRTNRRSWRKARFWCVLGAALVAQLGVGTLFLWDAPRLSTLIWGIVLPLDYAVVERCVILTARPTLCDSPTRPGTS